MELNGEGGTPFHEPQRLPGMLQENQAYSAQIQQITKTLQNRSPVPLLAMIYWGLFLNWVDKPWNRVTRHVFSVPRMSKFRAASQGGCLKPNRL